MRMRRMYFFMVLAVLGMAACEKEDMKISPEDQNLTTVKFEMDASNLIHGGATRSVQPVYSNAGFSIYAFRQEDNGNDFICNQIINGSTMTYDVNNKKLIGTARLPIGTYRFISAYGLVNPANIAMPAMVSQVLTDDLGYTHQNTGSAPEIFLGEGVVASLPPYTLGLTSQTNPTVTATLKRAVSRIDILFINATKNGMDYKEQAYPNGENIFGKKDLDTIQLRLTGLNQKMNFLGSRLGTATLDADIEVADLNNAVVIGTNPSQTAVGTEGFVNYDNIQGEDVIYGSAHVAGPYVFPGNDDSKNTGLELYIKPKNSIGRTITIVDKLPLERNKVTLVKIYVLEGNVFTTKVNFEVDIQTEWLGENEVIGEIN